MTESRERETITITNKAVAQRQSGHLWVFSGDVVDLGTAADGEIVRVVDGRGRPLGYALCSRHSKIALRWVAGAGDSIGRTFWSDRLNKAADHRRLVASGAGAYRVVFGESDLLPSLIVDRYEDHLVLQTLSPGMERLKSLWVDLLLEQYRPRAIIERNDVKVRQLEGLELRKGALFGSPADDLTVSMNGIFFRIDLLGGQKTGAFLDQRENYRIAGQYARGRSLDCFCYTGGFALHMSGSSDTVTAVDSSAEALAEAGRNAGLNGAANVEFLQANVFDFLREQVIRGARYDTIVLDPPAFAKSRNAIDGAIRGYKEINLRALQLLEPGGILITCSCSYHMNEQLFLGVLASAAADSHRLVRILEKRTQALDHPILLSMPETYYLKCIVLQAL